jgi:amino acid adenylation domain-containing protein
MGGGARSTGRCIHELFAAVAAAAPDAIAVESDDGLLPYRELARAATAVARDLTEAGVGIEDRVAIHGRLGPEVLAAMLGALEAGAAFVPLDPDEAPERARRTLEISRPRALLLAGGAEPASLPVDVPAMPVDLDAKGADRGRAMVPVEERNLAYVLFTSGSSGRPKGVAVEHRAIAAYLESVDRLYRLDGRWPSLPAITRFGFDASLLQTLGPLLRGDPVWLLPPRIAEDPPALLERLESRTGVALHCVPTLWRELLTAFEEGAAPDLRLGALLLGGEAVPEDLWNRTRELFPAARLANVYGPTEATVQVTGGYRTAAGGAPLASARVHVLDERLEEVPQGTEGEICIGGPQVARCYLGDAAATASAFLPDPFGEPGSRLYRSGDRGAWNPDGTLRVLGRRDRQIKLRGFRIELEEIEAALARHQEVAAAVAVAVDLDRPQARIQAAVEPRPGGHPTVEELRELAIRFLPRHMVPARLEVVPRLPRTAGGKLNRLRLFEDDPAEAAPGGAADDPVVEKVTAIWKEALGVEALAPDADFFVLGGHSLLVTKVVGRTRSEFGVKIPLRTLFDHPGLAAFATQVRLLIGEEGEAAQEAIPRRRDGGPALPSLQQLELHRSAEALRGTPFGNVLVPLRIAAGIPAEDVGAALAELAQRHAILRSVFRIGEGSVLQAEATDTALPLALHDAGGEPVEAATRAARALYAEAPPLDEGPLVRAAFVDGGEERLLVLCLDHLTCDGVSVRLLANDLSELLAARTEGRPPSPRGTDLQYADFAAWQRRRWSAGEYAPLVEYWRRELRRAPAPEARRRSFLFDTVRSSSPRAEWEQLKALASSRGVTPFVALSAAIQVLRRPPEKTLRVATLVAAREHPEVEQLIGPFANTVLLSLEDDTGFTAGALLDAVRRQVTGALANAALPLELVSRHLEGDEDVPLEADLGFNLEPEVDGSAGSGAVELVPASQVERGLSLVPSGLPLNVVATPLQGRLEIAVECEEGAVRAPEAAALATGIVPCAKALLANPEAPVSELARRHGEVAERTAASSPGA